MMKFQRQGCVLSNDYEELSIREVKPLDILCLRVGVSVCQEGDTSRDRGVSVRQEGDTWSRGCRGYRMQLLVCARDCSVPA
jgi:hypothetical protein